jgi:hypothetical protein
MKRETEREIPHLVCFSSKKCVTKSASLPNKRVNAVDDPDGR